LDATVSAPSFEFESLRRHRRIAVLTDGHSTPFLAKTAISLLRYRTADVAAVVDQPAAGQVAEQLFGTGGQIPIVSGLTEVPQADALYIGIAPPGGHLPEAWRPIISQAIQRGLDVVSGLHQFLSDDPDYRRAAEQRGVALIDVRKNAFRQIAMAQGLSTSCIRIHTVGQDCSLGKMVVSLEVQRGLAAAGYQASFLATGQTGIMIAGQGVPVDCVVADFVNGAIEQLVLATQHGQQFQLIEGQGSISHPAYSAVTLGLLHGAAPDGLIYCYEAGRTHVKGLNDIPLPIPEQQIAALMAAAQLRHPCQWIGIAVNTRQLDSQQARAEVDRAQQRFNLPACDVYRDGSQVLVQAAVSLRKQLLADRQAKA